MIGLKHLIPAVLICHVAVAAYAQKDRAGQVNRDRAKFLQDKFWIYNDLDRGIATAKRTGKPLLVVFR